DRLLVCPRGTGVPACPCTPRKCAQTLPASVQARLSVLPKHAVEMPSRPIEIGRDPEPSGRDSRSVSTGTHLYRPSHDTKEQTHHGSSETWHQAPRAAQKAFAPHQG